MVALKEGNPGRFLKQNARLWWITRV